MARRRLLILGYIIFFAGGLVFGQRSEITRKNNKVRNYSTVKFKKNRKMAEICPIFIVSEYPYQAIGIKLGDPFSVTYKLYALKWFAFGIDAGRAASGLYSQLHQGRFGLLGVEGPEPGVNYSGFQYISHKVLNQNTFSAKAFIYREGPRAIKGLDMYIGAGWQIQFADVKYDFNAFTENPDTITNGQSSFSFQPMGPEVVLGLEYAYFTLPLSAFVEGGIFYNIRDQQQWRKFQGGIGLRYVF